MIDKKIKLCYTITVIKKEYAMEYAMELFGIYYHYDRNLTGGYYSAKYGWHHKKSKGKFVFNIDDKGILFFNKI